MQVCQSLDSLLRCPIIHVLIPLSRFPPLSLEEFRQLLDTGTDQDFIYLTLGQLVIMDWAFIIKVDKLLWASRQKMAH